MFYPNPPQKLAIGRKPSVSQGNLSGASVTTQEKSQRAWPGDTLSLTPVCRIHARDAHAPTQLWAADKGPDADAGQMSKL